MPKIFDYEEHSRAPYPSSKPPLLDKRDVELARAPSWMEAAQGVAKNYEEQKRRSDEEQARAWASSASSGARLQWSQEFVRRQSTAEPGAPNFTGSMLEDFDKYADETVQKAPTGRSQFFVSQRMEELRAELGQKASVYEATARIDWRRDQFKASAQNIAKLMNTDPSQYEPALAAQLSLIDSSEMPQEAKSKTRDEMINLVSGAAVYAQVQRSPLAFLQSIGFYSTDKYGYRADGSPKGNGFLGPQKTPDGRVMTEYTIGVKIDGKETEIPTLVPTLTKEELGELVKTGKVTDAVADKAIAHAKERMAQGKSVFADSGSKTIRKSSGDLMGDTGNPAFDMLPFDKRIQAFQMAIVEKARLDADENKAIGAHRTAIAQAVGKDLWDLHFQGKLKDSMVRAAKPVLEEPDFKALMEAATRGPVRRDDPDTLSRVIPLVYNDPRSAINDLDAAYRAGRLADDTYRTERARAHSIMEQGGLKSEYERQRNWIITTLNPGELGKSDPVARQRLGDAVRAFDDWMGAAPRGKPRADIEIRERAEEILDQYRFTDSKSMVLALPLPRGTHIARTANPDVLGPQIEAAGRKLNENLQNGRLTPLEYVNELSTLNRWIKVHHDLEESAKQNKRKVKR